MKLHFHVFYVVLATLNFCNGSIGPSEKIKIKKKSFVTPSCDVINEYYI